MKVENLSDFGFHTFYVLIAAIAVFAAATVGAVVEATSVATVDYQEAVVQSVAPAPGETFIKVEAQGAIEIFVCPHTGTLGRVCQELQPGDIASFTGRPSPSDQDEAGVELLELSFRPPAFVMKPDDPGDRDGR